MRGRRPGPRLLAILIALTALCSLAGCSGPNFTSLADDLRFGDEEVADTQTVYSMKVPSGGLGKLIRHDQLAWAESQYAAGASAAGVTVRRLLISTPALQCETLKHTYQEETTEEGPWNWDERNRSCDKTRKLSWLEKTMWTMYEQQSDDTIDWLSTSHNTLVASGGTVSTLQANAVPMYDAWDANAGKYLNIAQAVLVIAAAISLTILGARIVWRIGEASGGGMDGHPLGRIGWIFLGVFMGSSAASIALTFFKRTSTTYMGDPAGASHVTNPSLMSWTPGQGTSFFVSDWVRLQVDPFLLIAAVCGVLAAGFKLITTQEGRDLIPLGKAFMWAMLTSVCLAGFVNLFQGTVDTWTAGVLKAASSMMKTAWSHNTLAASEFFNLDGPIALVLTIVMWLCNLISKVFCYLRAGLLPIMVGVAPMWAAMSWMETGRQAFGKVMGWLFAFLLYKPVAALVMAAGCSIMVTAGSGDDSQAITLMITISVIVLLPAMIRLIVPAVAGSVSVIPSMLGGMASDGGRPPAPDGAKPSGGSDPAAPSAVDGAGRGTAGGAESSLPDPTGTQGARRMAGRRTSRPRRPERRRADGIPPAYPDPIRPCLPPPTHPPRPRGMGPMGRTASPHARPRSSEWLPTPPTAIGCAPSRAASATSADP